jgi:hypothetical protein
MTKAIINDFAGAGSILLSIFLIICAACLFIGMIYSVRYIFKLILSGATEGEESIPCYFFLNKNGEFIGRVIIHSDYDNLRATEIALRNPDGLFIHLYEDSNWIVAKKHLSRWTKNSQFNAK